MTHPWGDAFDAAAPDYDTYATGDGWPPNERAAELLAPLGLAPARILDLGAGTGLTSSVLLGLLGDADLTLVDPSPGMLGVARAKLPGATFVVADAAAFLAAAEEQWDLVAGIGCLELVPDQFEVLRLAAERLTPGGHLVVSHEPLLASGVQSRPVSHLPGGRTVRRHTVEEVERRAASYGLERLASRVDPTFARGDVDEDVVYELVVWAKG